MKKLKHPRPSIGEPFGKAGLIVAVVALLMAMLGGAYAAGGTAIKANPSGTGRRGPGGPKGARGPKGAKGPRGPSGMPGENGVDVTFSPASEAACAAGGSVFKASNGETTICNGEDGKTGYTETLPPGQTEAGVWAGTFKVLGPVPISFNIPLAAPMPGSDVKIVPEGGTPPAECKNPQHAGAASVENPEAKAGFLCIYVSQIEEGSVVEAQTAAFQPGAGSTGTVLVLESTESEIARGRGSWAVTAPTSP